MATDEAGNRCHEQLCRASTSCCQEKMLLPLLSCRPKLLNFLEDCSLQTPSASHSSVATLAGTLSACDMSTAQVPMHRMVHMLRMLSMLRKGEVLRHVTPPESVELVLGVGWHCLAGRCGRSIAGSQRL